MGFEVGGGYEHEMTLSSDSGTPDRALTTEQLIELQRTTTLVVVHGRNNPTRITRYIRYDLPYDPNSKDPGPAFFRLINTGTGSNLNVLAYSSSQGVWYSRMDPIK